MNSLRVLLADDHALVRAGIRALLENIEGVTVVAEAANGNEAVALARQYRPEIVLLDISMPELNGLEACARIRREFPEMRAVILSMHADEEYVLRALRNGAKGYMLKDSAIDELAQVLKTVSAGEVYLSPPISRQVLDDYRSRVGGETASSEQLPAQLTDRQMQILRLIAEGVGTRAIAEQLELSVKTVETHRANLMERLDIRDVAGLVRYAIRTGLISADR